MSVRPAYGRLAPIRQVMPGLAISSFCNFLFFRFALAPRPARNCPFVVIA
jgi:hypothetical protein